MLPPARWVLSSALCSRRSIRSNTPILTCSLSKSIFKGQNRFYAIGKAIYKLDSLRLPTDLVSTQPSSINWILDKARLLPPQAEAECNKWIQYHYATYGICICIVTVPNLADGYESTKDFAADLFDYWKVGSANGNKGILFVLNVADSTIEMNFGDGLQFILNDDVIDDLLFNAIVPNLTNKNYSEAFMAGLAALDAHFAPNHTKLTLKETHQEHQSHQNSSSSAPPPDPQASSKWGFAEKLGLVLLIGTPLLAFIFMRDTEYDLDEALKSLHCPQCDAGTSYFKPAVPSLLRGLGMDNCCKRCRKCGYEKCDPMYCDKKPPWHNWSFK